MDVKRSLSAFFRRLAVHCQIVIKPLINDRWASDDAGPWNVRDGRTHAVERVSTTTESGKNVATTPSRANFFVCVVVGHRSILGLDLIWWS